MVFEKIKEALGFAKTQALNTPRVKRYNNDFAAVEAKFVVGLVIGVYLLAALIPSAITAINGTNTTGWNASQTAIWGVLSIIILAVIIMKISE